MKNVISKKFLIPFVSASLILVTGIILACASGEDFSNFYNSFFAPEVSQTSEGSPFYRTVQTFYGDVSFHDAVNTFDSINIDEWHHYFSKKVMKKDLVYLVYQSPIGQLDSLIFFIKNTNFPLIQHLRKNSLLLVEDKATVKEALFYLGFAKRCEPFATYNPGWWKDNKKDPRENTGGMDKLIQGGKKALVNIKSGFIRERYLFQIMRLLYNSGRTSECIDYYDQHKDEFTSGNTIHYRTLGYVAACYYDQKNFSEANYLYAVLFDKCKPMRQTAFLSFHPQEEADWKGSLALAKNLREKETLWHLLGIYVDPQRAMEQIYALNPKSNLLNLLLVRAVNINEELFVPNISNWYGDKDSTYVLKSQKVDSSLFSFVRKIADAGNTEKAFLWNLSAGYLCLASGDYQHAAKYFDKAEGGSVNHTLVNDQIRAFRLMSRVETYVKPDPNTEDLLTSELSWLDKEKHLPAFRSGCIYAWSLSRLSEKYRAWGDTTKAQCLDQSQYQLFYDNEKQIIDMISLMDKPRKTKFEQFILSVHPYHRSELFNHRAIKLIYQYKFREALAMFDNAKGSGDSGIDSDPFIIHIKDCHDCDILAEKKDVYSKYTFLQRMLELERKIVSVPKRASEYYFLMANGFYNMTYFGNAHDVYSGAFNGIITTGLVSFYYPNETLTSPVFDCSKAAEYYKKAMKASSDKEFKTKCCFMAAKCEQNVYFVTRSMDYKNSIKSGLWFKRLRSDFSKTTYYKEIIEECGYFRTFLGMQK